ncbi:thermonuclease family protein [Desulfovibrio desulfuricans]|uniref:thermonuclease family protein n=1 Tax=Desulfovibrio desulfuricans TaxID=876 RepID=UPI001FFCA631|nr:thermonuclease family protein [Desulfovibrio desulfuricans]
MLIRLLTFIVFIISTALPAVAETTWTAYVVNVEDGNTISVSTKHGSDEPEAVLIFYGIEAPSHNQPFGPEAVAYLKSVMPKGTKVGVETVGQLEAGPIAALVQVGGDSINYKMVMGGLAWVDRQKCRAIFCRRWLIQEHQAVVDRRGIWSLNMSTPPWQWGR